MQYIMLVYIELPLCLYRENGSYTHCSLSQPKTCLKTVSTLSQIVKLWPIQRRFWNFRTLSDYRLQVNTCGETCKATV